MRTNLIIFGIIFLVLGVVLYFLPMQEFKANTTTTGNGNIDNRTSYANITIPIVYAYASIAIGLILLILGLTIPYSDPRGDSKKDSYNKVVESKENIVLGRGNNKRIVRERTKRYSSRGDKNDN